MEKIFYKKFDYSSSTAAVNYQKQLIDQVLELGFDGNIVKYDLEYEYRCSHRYPDYFEVYIETDDESIITALKIVE